MPPEGVMLVKRCVYFSGLVLSWALAAAWTVRVESAAGRDNVIKFAYVSAPTDARHLSAVKFKEWVEEASGGSLRVELYSGGQLGGDRDAIEGVKLGTIEMTTAGAGIFANFRPQMGITAFPFLFDSFEAAWAFNDSELNASVTDQMLSEGIRVLGHWDNGFRCITNSRRPIETPEDLQGLKIRTPENPIILATMEALGANPSPLPWPELYMALQQGAFDGQENPIPTIYVNKLHETQEYLALTNHVYEPMPVVINEAFWTRLSPKEQEVIQRAVERSQDYNRNLVQQMTEEFLVELEEAGMQVSSPDRAAFEAKTKDVREQYREIIGKELVDQVYEFAEKQNAQSNAL
jgi:tripartite ATP-independent transporter DctP family solute receptor